MSALPSGWHEKWGFLRPRAPGPRRALPSHPGAAARVPARIPARPERAGRRAAERAQLRARHSPPPASRGSAAGAPAASSGGAPAPPPAARSATPRRGGARLHRGADASSASEAALPGASPPRDPLGRVSVGARPHLLQRRERGLRRRPGRGGARGAGGSPGRGGGARGAGARRCSGGQRLGCPPPSRRGGPLGFPLMWPPPRPQSPPLSPSQPQANSSGKVAARWPALSSPALRLLRGLTCHGRDAPQPNSGAFRSQASVYL